MKRCDVRRWLTAVYFEPVIVPRGLAGWARYGSGGINLVDERGRVSYVVKSGGC